MCLLPAHPVSAAERPVITIGDNVNRSSSRYNENMGVWRYLADLFDVDIRYVYMTDEEYAAGLASGDLPDLVATDKNLSTILENGVALDADPYLSEYCPNLLKGEAKQTYDVFKKLGNEGDGFYFFPAKIGYNGVGFDNETSSRGYVVRWDYYKELGYPPINNEDDYLKVLLQMHKNHPYTEEGYPTYLYGNDNFGGYDTAFRSELKSNRRILVFLNMSLPAGTRACSFSRCSQGIFYIFIQGASALLSFYSADLWARANIGIMDPDRW